MRNFSIPDMLTTLHFRHICKSLLALSVLAKTASAQDYCQYFFSFVQNDAQRWCEISNVFSYPTTQYPGNSGFYCYSNYQQAQYERNAQYNRFATAKYMMSTAQQKDYCDPVQERSRAEQNQRQQERALENERLQYSTIIGANYSPAVCPHCMALTSVKSAWYSIDPI